MVLKGGTNMKDFIDLRNRLEKKLDSMRKKENKTPEEQEEYKNLLKKMIMVEEVEIMIKTMGEDE